MLFRDVTAVNSENHTNPINADLLIVKADGTCNHLSALKN
jgi:hypothetical protein